MKLRFSKEKYLGKLIIFCGLDGSGKTSMINMLEERLKLLGHKCFITFQPTSNMRKTKIFRNYMDSENHDSHSFISLNLQAVADRIQHCENEIIPRLKAGEIVISDRYYFSCIANLNAYGYKDEVWAYDLAKYVPEPDLAFFLDVPADKAINRVRLRPEEKDRYIDINLQHRLSKEYRNVCNETDNGILINSNRDEKQTFSDIWESVTEIFSYQEMISK